MSNEHFVAGATSGQDPRDTPILFSVLGHTGETTVRAQLNDRQADRLYIAENRWTDPKQSDSIGSRSTSSNNAKDLLYEAIFHPHMDEIPGIEHVRNNLLNNPNSIQINGRKINEDDSSLGRVNIKTGKLQVRASRGPKDTLSIYRGWINPVTKRIEESEDHPAQRTDVSEEALAESQAIRDEVGKDYHPFYQTPIKGHVRLGVATHEGAHLISSKIPLNHPQFGEVHGLIGHSWPMARIHIRAVGALFGDKHAKVLKDHYERLGVDFGR